MKRTILGLAMGAAQQGMLPMPEIQYLAYLHNAIDQIRGEACSLSFFSQGAFQNPMVVQVLVWPTKGIWWTLPQRQLRGSAQRHSWTHHGMPFEWPRCSRHAPNMYGCSEGSRSGIGFLEPIALYMTKDLHEEKKTHCGALSTLDRTTRFQSAKPKRGPKVMT